MSISESGSAAADVPPPSDDGIPPTESTAPHDPPPPDPAAVAAAAPGPAPTTGRGWSIVALVAAAVAVIVAIVGFVTVWSLSDDVEELEREVAELEEEVAADQEAIADASARSDDLEARADELADRLAAAESSGPAPVDRSAATEPTGAPGGLPAFPGNGLPDPAVGSPLPDISGVDHLTGDAVDLADGSPTMIMLWAHWCPHCQRELPEVQSLVDEGYFADNGVELVTIATFEDATRGNPFERMVADYTFPVIRDDEDRAGLLGLGGVPSWVVVDADGVVIGRFSGALGADVLRGVVDQVAAEG